MPKEGGKNSGRPSLHQKRRVHSLYSSKHHLLADIQIQLEEFKQINLVLWDQWKKNSQCYTGLRTNQLGEVCRKASGKVEMPLGTHHAQSYLFLRIYISGQVTLCVIQIYLSVNLESQLPHLKGRHRRIILMIFWRNCGQIKQTPLKC